MGWCLYLIRVCMDVCECVHIGTIDEYTAPPPAKSVVFPYYVSRNEHNIAKQLIQIWFERTGATTPNEMVFGAHSIGCMRNIKQKIENAKISVKWTQAHTIRITCKSDVQTFALILLISIEITFRSACDLHNRKHYERRSVCTFARIRTKFLYVSSVSFHLRCCCISSGFITFTSCVQSINWRKRVNSPAFLAFPNVCVCMF